jgi:Ca-activated chloride channel family protein
MSSKFLRHGYAVCLLLALTSCQKVSDPQSEYVNVKSFYYDWLSRQALELKQNQTAHDFVLKALEYQNSVSLQTNLGVTFGLLEKKEDAEKSFLSALGQASTNEEKFKINFNLGVLLGAQKKIPEALAFYQAALDILPTSIETKHNIELLIQQQQQDKKKQDQEQKGEGQGSGNDQDKNENKESKPDKENDKQDDKQKKEDQGKDRKSNSKYKPRPYKGEQLSEGDVKKILGELSQQDQKIRSNFNKKEQRKEDKNEKDW